MCFISGGIVTLCDGDDDVVGGRGEPSLSPSSDLPALYPLARRSPSAFRTPLLGGVLRGVVCFYLK